MEISEIEGLSAGDLDWMKSVGIHQMPKITRSQFQALKPSDRVALSKAGIVLANDPEPKPVVLKEGQISRKQFDAMTEAQKYEVSRKLVIVDVD